MKKLFPLLYGLIGFFCNCFLQVLLCAFIAWLISLTFVGTWISDALSTVLRPIELYKIGALIGFFRGLRISFSLPSSDDIQKAWNADKRFSFMR